MTGICQGRGIKPGHIMVEWTWIYLTITLVTVHAAGTGRQEVCQSQKFTASCDSDEIIVIDSAQYGRMEGGRCGVTSEGGHIGCSNDVIFLADDKCSGRRECDFIVGDTEFDDANKDCNKELRAYLKISYSCVKVEYHEFADCLSQSRIQVRSHEGFISSHVTDETGCGSLKTPWALNAKPGQTIDIALLDFGALSRRTRRHGCDNVYGYLVEKSLDVNESICAGAERRHHLYSSKSNQMEIGVISQTQRRDDSLFLLHYKVVGCSDLTPPAHASYKRDGHVATIGCIGTENNWQLTCHGNSWEGVVGNCSAKPIMSADTDQKATIGGLPVNTLLAVAAIVGATLVLALLIIVAGVICVKKYRHDRESRMSSLPGTLVYQTKPSIPGESPPRGQYHPMTLASGTPGSSTLAPSTPGTSTMCSVHHARTMPVRGPYPGHPGATPPLQAQRAIKQGAPPPPRGRPGAHHNMNAAAPTHSPPRPPGQPSTSTGVFRTNPNHPLWTQPVPEDSAFGDAGVYQNPDDIIDTPSRPALPPGVTDPDDISSYYAPTTGHKYFILERQPDNSNESHS